MRHEQHITEPRSSAPPLTYGPAEVAAALGIDEATFRARREELEREGFPKRLPVLRARWSAEAVRAWIALAGVEEGAA